MAEEVAGANELAAMAGKAFQKSNDKKAKKAARAERDAAGPVKKGFRKTAGGGGERAPRPPKIGAKKRADQDAGDADGGDADGEEEEQDKPRARAAAGAAKKKGGGKGTDNKWTYIGLLLLICMGSLQVIIPVFENVFGSGSSSGRGGTGSGTTAFNYPAVSHVKLDVSDTDAMRRVFFSGESWLVLCNNHSTNAAQDVPHTVFERAAAMLHHTQASAKSHPIFSALLPCHDFLAQSGKNIYERWDLPLPTTTLVELDSLRGVPKRTHTNRDGTDAGVIKHYVPTAFYVSNGDKPRAVAPSFFGYREKDDVLTTTAHKLAEMVREHTKPRTAVTVTNSAHLTNHCTKRRHCALFLYESDDYKMPPAVREQINSVCGTYRALRCAALDVVRYKSSLVRALPALLDASAPAFPRLVLTKKLTEDELKKLADDEAAEAAKTPKPEADPTAAGSDADANPSRTVNPKLKVLKSIGLQAKAHRGTFTVPALSQFIETVLGLSPAWHNPEEVATRATPVGTPPPSADDKKMTALRDWPTVSAKPYSELPKKAKKPAAAAAPKKRAAARKPAATKPKTAPAAAAADAAKPTGDAKADAADAKAQAKAEAEIRARMDQEEADRAPQAADDADAAAADGDADAAAAADDAEGDDENIDLDDAAADEPKLA